MNDNNMHGIDHQDLYITFNVSEWDWMFIELKDMKTYKNEELLEKKVEFSEKDFYAMMIRLAEKYKVSKKILYRG